MASEYWIMQLHPSASREPYRSAQRVLSRNEIGVGFNNLPEQDMSFLDLSKITDPIDRRYVEYFHDGMQPGDIVLVVEHQIAVALVEIVGPYEFVPNLAWPPHRRKVRVLGWYPDFVEHPTKPEEMDMRGTLQKLEKLSRVGKPRVSYKLVERWLRFLAAQATPPPPPNQAAGMNQGGVIQI
jgi:hypothetical protein